MFQPTTSRPPLRTPGCTAVAKISGLGFPGHATLLLPFLAFIAITPLAAPEKNSGTLEVRGGDTITVEYIDAHLLPAHGFNARDSAMESPFGGIFDKPRSPNPRS